MDYCPGTNCYYTSSSDGSSSATKININGGGKEKKTSVKKGKGGGVKLSTDPQSVAARERRHRISDRFKILQSLVPGGTKMDTVSMLEEAIHYVKFLKTQIWLHQTMINLNADDDVIIPSPSSSLSPPSPYVCLDDNNPVLPAAAATGSGFATVSASADQYAQYYNNNNFSTNYSAAVQVQPSSSSMAVPYPDSYNCFQGQETMPMNNIEAYMKYYS